MAATQLQAEGAAARTNGPVDCRRRTRSACTRPPGAAIAESAKEFLRARGVAYEEIDIDEDLDAEEIVLRVNDGRRKVPTIQYGDRYFACSPFDPKQLATELNLPLNGRR